MPKQKILVVDDEFLIRSIISEILESKGYLAEEAENGKEALEKYREQKSEIALIISDMNMPVMGGIEFIKNVRMDETDVPIVILSGNSEISTAIEAINEGANDYLLKDENIQETIFLSINRVLEKQALTRENAELLESLKIKNAELESFNDTLSQTISDLTKIGTALSSERNLDKLLEMIVREATSITKADEVTLYIYEDEKLKPKIYQDVSRGVFKGGASDADTGLPSLAIDAESPVSRCFNRRKVIHLSDKNKFSYEYDADELGEDGQFDGASPEIAFLAAVPLKDRDNKTLGVLELKKRQADRDSENTDFQSKDISIAYSLASQAAVCIENAQTYQIIKRKKDAFQNFVPTEFLSFLGREEIEDVLLGDSSRETISILFSDIRSFTTLSESMTSEENFIFLNEYLKSACPGIVREGGFIDKYIGDAIMALFPGRVVGVADDAVKAAIEMQRSIREFNFFRKKNGELPIKYGIGIHTGPVSLGTLGFENRMETTVIGDTVNIASRIEGLTKMYGVDLAVSSETFGRLKSLSPYFYRELDTVIVKGKNEPVTIYDIFNGDSDYVKEKKIETQDQYDEALSLYKDRKWADALKSFDGALRIFDDQVVKGYIKRCQTFIENPPDDSWNGATALFSK